MGSLKQKMKTKKQWRKAAWTALRKEREEMEEALANLENADPELCIKFMRYPSVHNLSGLKKKIGSCSKDWMVEFLSQDGLVALFITMERLSEETMRDDDLMAVAELIHCIGCVKAVMNSRVGLDYVISHEKFIRMLSKTLTSSCTTVKKQIFELLAALCIYSEDGKARATDALEHYKKAKSHRYRFSAIMNELRSTENLPYKAAILSCVNALILSTTSLYERIHLRNEFIGLQLLDDLFNLRRCRFKELLVQVDVFYKTKLKDEEDLPEDCAGADGIDIYDHKSLFFAVFNKVCNTPQANHLLTILQCLLKLNPDDKITDAAWEVLDRMAQRTVAIATEREMKRLLYALDRNSNNLNLTSTMQDSSVQTIEISSVITSSEHEKSSSSSTVPPPPPINGVPSPPPIGGVPHPPPISGVPPPPPIGGVPPPPPIGGVPPPPPIGGVPPPPPIGGVPPPPPPIGGNLPPSGGATQTGAIKRIATVPKPTAKLRKINWQKVPRTLTKSKHSIWNSFDDDDYEIVPDYKTIQRLFERKVIANKTEHDAHDAKKVKPTKVTLIDSLKSMNVGIFLLQLRKPNEEIIKALVDGNRELLTEERLKMMKKYLPEKSEIETINNFPDDKSTLADVEKYFLLLSKVSHYQLRIEAGIARETFEEDMQDLTPTIRNIKQACKDILHSEKLKDFLVLILRTGNYMNYGSHTGDADGFKISSLLKLADTKANKPRMTLLHYVVMEAGSNYPELLKLPDEMKVVIKCKGVSVKQVEKEVKSIKSSISKLKKQVKKSSSDIQRQFGSFLKDANDRTSSFDKDIEEMEKLRLDLAEYFVEEEKKFMLEECLTTVAKFAEQISSAIEENKERAIREEKKKKREALKERSGRMKGKKKKADSPPQENIIDNLLSGIRKGFKLRKVEINSSSSE